MPRITALLVLGAILIAGCDAVTPGRQKAGSASHPVTVSRSSSETSGGQEHTGSPASEGDGENIPRNAAAPGFPLVTIGTILESFLPR